MGGVLSSNGLTVSTSSGSTGSAPYDVPPDRRAKEVAWNAGQLFNKRRILCGNLSPFTLPLIQRRTGRSNSSRKRRLRAEFLSSQIKGVDVFCRAHAQSIGFLYLKVKNK